MPLRVGLTQTLIKLSRAHKHLKELEKVVTEFRENAYTETRKDNPGKGVHHAFIHLNFTPHDLACLPGEFAYSLRSALDMLAWQLALLTTDTPNDVTCFPIYGGDREPPRNTRYWESVENFPASATSIVHDLQPYKRKASFKSHPLWQLNKLCNVDKHQLLAVCGTTIELRVDGVTKYWRDDSNHAIAITVPLAEKEQLQLNINVPRITFGDPIDSVDAVSDFEIGIERLEEIYNFVRDEVIPKFERFFP